MTIASLEGAKSSQTSWLKYCLVIARNQQRLILRNIEAVVALVVMPIALLLILTPILGPLSRQIGAGGGAEFSVPGVVVTFAFVAVGFAAGGTFREHGWGTWARLRTSPAPPTAIIAGIVIPYGYVLLLQMMSLFGLGALAFGFKLRGSLLALILTCVALTWCLLALAMALVAISTNIQQVYIFTNIGSLVLCGIGGALVPVELFPAWLRHVAPAFPSYWAIRGFRSVTLQDGGLSDVVLPILILIGTGAVLFVCAAARFRFDDHKVA
jgi:ABC-2 type transport system permease protein